MVRAQHDLRDDRHVDGVRTARTSWRFIGAVSRAIADSDFRPVFSADVAGDAVRVHDSRTDLGYAVSTRMRSVGAADAGCRHSAAIGNGATGHSASSTCRTKQTDSAWSDGVGSKVSSPAIRQQFGSGLGAVTGRQSQLRRGRGVVAGL